MRVKPPVSGVNKTSQNVGNLIVGKAAGERGQQNLSKCG